MTPFDFGKEEEIESAFAEAIKAYSPPVGLQAAVKERLFGQGNEKALTRHKAFMKRRIAQYAAVLAVVVLLSVALATWNKFTNLGTSIAFADVQEAIRNVETAIETWSFVEEPWMNFKTFYRRDSEIVRVEWSREIWLLDLKNGRELILNPEKKAAGEDNGQKRISSHLPLGDFATPREYLDNLANIEQKAVKPLGQREFGGQNLVGFALPRDKNLYHMHLQVWVDPKTRLPIRLEILPDDPNELAAKFRAQVITFTYNVPLDASLFQFSKPEDYTVLPIGVELPYGFPPAPQDDKLTAPVIEPEVGIGPAKFGMTLNQVLEVLGQPDDAQETWANTPEESRLLEEMAKKATKEAEEKGLKGLDKSRFVSAKVNKAVGGIDLSERHPDGIRLAYISRGLQLYLTNNDGLASIFCAGKDWSLQPFKGKTSKGIGIDSTMAEIEQAYGPPSFKSESRVENHQDTGLLYKTLNMQIHLRNGRVWQMDFGKP